MGVIVIAFVPLLKRFISLAIIERQEGIGLWISKPQENPKVLSSVIGRILDVHGLSLPSVQVVI